MSKSKVYDTKLYTAMLYDSDFGNNSFSSLEIFV